MIKDANFFMRGYVDFTQGLVADVGLLEVRFR